MPLIQYTLDHNLQYSYLALKEVPAYVDKLKGIGAKNFLIYDLACSCSAGYVYDQNGQEVPCDRCSLGCETYRYENGFAPDPVF
jgi:hypothetical protein